MVDALSNAFYTSKKKNLSLIHISLLFCFTGYYNGCGKTFFVMIQGIVGAFGVRIPFAYLMSQLAGTTLFHIGLATPASSLVQIILCLIMFVHLGKKQKRKGEQLSAIS